MVKVLPSDDVINTSSTTQDLPIIHDVEKQRSNPSHTGPMESSKTSTFQSLGWLDRFLALWIFLAMLVGILLGNFVSDVGPALQKGEFVGVSVPIGKFSTSSASFSAQLMQCIAVGLLVMMYPILCKVKYETLHHVFREREIWVQLGFSIIVNWIVAPLLMVRPLGFTELSLLTFGCS